MLFLLKNQQLSVGRLSLGGGRGYWERNSWRAVERWVDLVFWTARA